VPKKPKSVVLTAGDVYDYPYLWKRENLNREIEGRKNRPCAFVATVSDQLGRMTAIILAITGSFDGNGIAIEIPDIEKHRAGLDGHKALWIVLSEYNYDVIGNSSYFLPTQKLGRFSASFTKTIIARLMQVAKSNTITAVNRTT
jgi:hypothetical protein